MNCFIRFRDVLTSLEPDDVTFVQISPWLCYGKGPVWVTRLWLNPIPIGGGAESTLRGINVRRTRWKKRFLPWNFCDNILEFRGTHFEKVAGVAGDAEKIDFLKNNLNTIVWYLVGKKNSLRVFWRKNQLKIWIFSQVTAILVWVVDAGAVFAGN